MAEKHDLLILPNQGDSSIVLSETRSSLAARGRRDAADLTVRARESSRTVAGQAQLHKQGRNGQPPVFPPPLALLHGAAESGEASAQNDLGVVYEIAETYPKGPGYWVKIVSKSASGAPSAEAMSHLSRLASLTRRDYELAAFWYRRAAEQGLAVAQNNLAFLYSSGQGVPRDNTQAAVWFRRAAEQGLGRAQILLAEFYEKGLGVPKDYLQAELWLRKAAEQNIWRAKHELGILYCKGGEGLQPDFEEACFWLYLAAMGKKNANQDKSSKALDAAAAKLTQSQLSAVQKRAENWSPRITKTKA